MPAHKRTRKASLDFYVYLLPSHKQANDPPKGRRIELSKKVKATQI